MPNASSLDTLSTVQEQFNLAFAHLSAKRWPEAETGFRSFLARWPFVHLAHFNLGVALKNQGKYQEALTEFQTALAMQPNFPEACNAVGDVLYHLSRPAEAVPSLRRAVELRPDFADAWNNLGITLQEIKQDEESVAAHRRAVALQPDFAEAWNNLGNALRRINLHKEAVEALYRALALQPQRAEIWNNLGSTLRQMQRMPEAIDAYQRALKLRPDYPEAVVNLGNIRSEMGQQVEAIETYRHALELRGDYALGWVSLASVLAMLGNFDESLTCLDRAAALQPDDQSIVSSRICSLHYHPDYDAPAIFREAQRWNRQFAGPLTPEIPAHENDPSPGRRLRIGYVSRDFRVHSVAMFLPPLLANHDHHDFEIYCYNNAANYDPVTFRLKRYADQWRDVASKSDHDLARLIHEDKIDILVDLSLHTGGNRLMVFARKPAPLQVTWVGYPGTTGLEAIDYRLTDPQLDPVRTEARNPKSEIRINDPNPNDPNPNESISPGAVTQPDSLPHSDIGKLTSASSVEPGFDSDFGFRASGFESGISDFATKEPYYSEKSIRLPDCFWCYDPRAINDAEDQAMPEPGPLPALAAGHVTFGCLNNFCKATPPTLALWSKVMAGTPNSRLILLAPDGPHRQQVVERLGVAADRVEFLPFRPRPQYMETYRRIDLCLDTIPYNGHTTNLDALWMGVPVITRVGKTVVGRAGWSQLHNLDLNELVAWSDEEFVSIALRWAGDLDRLGRLRAELRQRMERSPLMDGRRFTRNVEAAYRQMWQAWCQAREVQAR